MRRAITMMENIPQKKIDKLVFIHLAPGHGTTEHESPELDLLFLTGIYLHTFLWEIY